MRPRRLALRGFTAFREPQEVDFTDLEVFAITGPTGSGKSSLLDALTFALYGTVERVGRNVKELISQGQARASVSLDFEVGLERWQVTRTIHAGAAATDVLLERWDGDEFVQAGDGADRVREVDARLRDILGLDYTGFTRAVLLPQGKFAEFLVGDPAKRRDILTDLLDLRLYPRLSARANEISQVARAKAEDFEERLATDYADATPASLAAAREEVGHAEGRRRALEGARVAVAEAVAAGSSGDRAAADLAGLAVDARAIGRQAADEATRLEDVGRDLVGAEEATRLATEAGAAARAARDSAEAALVAAETEHGTGAEIGARRERARALEDLARRVAAARDAVPAAQAIVAEASAAVEATVGEDVAREAALISAREALAAAEAAREAAHQADVVASLTAGLAIGDPCPVCGTALAALPGTPAAAAIAETDRAVVAARERLAAADGAARQAAAGVERARAAHVAGEQRVATLAAALVVAEAERAAAAAELAASFGGVLPEDPGGALDGLLARFAGLARARDAAVRELEDRVDAYRAAERDLATARLAVVTARARLDGLPVASLVARARAAGVAATDAPERAETPAEGALRAGAVAPTATAAPSPTKAGVAPTATPGALAAGDAGPTAADAAALGTSAGGLAAFLDELGEALDVAAAAKRRTAAAHLAAAEAATAGLVASPGTLDGLAAAVDEALAEAIGDAARAQAAISDLERRIGRRAELVVESAAQRARGLVFRKLAVELQANRIVTFLQGEALEILAAAGSVHLERLSSGRYRLVYAAEEFSVVDTWNGEERRSVRTLSGGETFLASLALALALAEQVPSLAATERSRMTSLFLDEGFGTLDPETLEAATAAIEVLGGDGRLVGVITHVRELAEQLPRIEIEKSPRGSRIVRR